MQEILLTKFLLMDLGSSKNKPPEALLQMKHSPSTFIPGK
jgi:hypothetical protein